MDRLFIVWIVAAAMAASAWGACTTSQYIGCSGFRYPNENLSCQNTYGSNCSEWSGVAACGHNIQVNVKTCESRSFPYMECVDGGTECNSSSGRDYVRTHCTIYSCPSQAEADSVRCALHPDAAGCVVEVDTTLYACSESVQGGVVTSTLYRLSCKATGGQVTSCNGKTNVDIPTDGTPLQTFSGTCAQNGYQNGITGGERDSSGANADCFAVVADKCYMKDKRSGNTFTCDCDGSCDYALRQIASGQCTNPYPQDEQQGDSIALPLSSWEPPQQSSSSAEPSSGASFGSELDALNNLYGVLDTIRDTLNKRVAPSVDAIQANTQYIGQQLEYSNEYLKQVAAKEWSVDVNVSAPNVNVENNTDVSGIQSRQDRQYSADTSYQSHMLAALAGFTGDSVAGNPSDTAGSGAALQGQLDRIDSAVGAFDVPDMSDSIAPTLQGIRGEVAAMRDSIANGAMGDSVDAWTNAFLNNGVLTGSGSNTCPAPLTRQVSFTFPHVGTINAGTLGRYLCSPIAGFSVTLWQVARMLLRALVAIGCMWWLFKEVTGTTTGGQNDDD